MAAGDAMAGRVVAIWRYPVKSMMGEELTAADFATRGMAGDRAFALVDAETGKVASAKNPKVWPNLFEFRARYLDTSLTADGLEITLPDGQRIRGSDPQVNEVLSRAVGRPVRLAAAGADQRQLEEYWPDLEELPHRDEVTDEPVPPGTFFDAAAVHLLTTATLDALRAAYPPGRFETRRFRPNLVIQATSQSGYPENGWHGSALRIGEELELKIDGPCPRCVMTTLAQGDLPQDLGVLRTAAQRNKAHVGVYASVVRAGSVRRGGTVGLAGDRAAVA